MGKHSWWNNCVEMTWKDPNGKVLFTEMRKNILVDSGEKAMVDTFLRGQEATYFPVTDFYMGLYSGSISESTILTTVPGEPSSNGYVRQIVERTTAGWPTLEQDEGDWRAVSKEVTFTSTGGDIGPISGAFLATSLNDLGTLICSVSSSVERTILSGASLSLNMRIKFS